MQILATNEEDMNTGRVRTAPHSALNARGRHGKMTVFIKSKRVLVTTKIVNLPPSFSGLVPTFSSGVKRLSIYENLLDEDQKAVVENSVELAKSLGLELEVKDVAMLSIFARFLGLLRGSRLPARTPSVSFEGSAIALIRGNPHLVEKDLRQNLKEEHEIAL